MKCLCEHRHQQNKNPLAARDQAIPILKPQSFDLPALFDPPDQATTMCEGNLQDGIGFTDLQLSSTKLVSLHVGNSTPLSNPPHPLQPHAMERVWMKKRESKFPT
jgi:hypothetical protein